MPRSSIRPATAADLPLILSLIRELAAYEREPDAVEATVESLRVHLFGEGLGRGPTAECVIGELDGTPQGFALFFHNFSTWKGRPGIYLEDLFVRPAARGSGLGKALLTHLAKLTVARGCGGLAE
jgi:GNAT superfamily N-acetyltransferase